jgi:hypothetical protein
MQEPQQIQSGIGSLQDPRQGYFLGKLVKKATRGIKKIAKSPIGKLALLAGGAYGLGALGGAAKGGGFLNMLRTGGMKNFGLSQIGGGLSRLAFGLKGGKGLAGQGLLGMGGAFDPKRAFLTAGATAAALPFFMGGEDEEEEVVDVMDPRYQVQRAKNYYSGAGDAGAGLDFMPQKQYVMENFYAADGGLASIDTPKRGMVDGPGSYAGFRLMNEDIKFRRPPGKFDFLKETGPISQSDKEFLQNLSEEDIKELQEQNGPFIFEIIEKILKTPYLIRGGDVLNDPQTYPGNKDGGRIGYANGMMVEEDDEEEFIRSGAGQSFRQRKTFLNMGGGAGQAQAEQMLMMEYVKYKNKGGTLSFEQFVKAVMQASQQPEGAGMEQPVAMAADGGLMTQVPGYTTPEGYNKFDYPSGGKEVRVGKQEGGIMETEVSEEIMPLLDMGGKEKDYRETGGFVELGRKERADDVPARLSKNEFVFTADAVRNAGGGDIDKGAEVMENLMNNLEQGGEISEESQGLEGAQAMYEQQQMLQSRMI